jgi:hypothetical protein
MDVGGLGQVFEIGEIYCMFHIAILVRFKIL